MRTEVNSGGGDVTSGAHDDEASESSGVTKEREWAEAFLADGDDVSPAVDDVSVEKQREVCEFVRDDDVGVAAAQEMARLSEKCRGLKGEAELRRCEWELKVANLLRLKDDDLRDAAMALRQKDAETASLTEALATAERQRREALEENAALRTAAALSTEAAKDSREAAREAMAETRSLQLRLENERKLRTAVETEHRALSDRVLEKMAAARAETHRSLRAREGAEAALVTLQTEHEAERRMTASLRVNLSALEKKLRMSEDAAAARERQLSHRDAVLETLRRRLDHGLRSFDGILSTLDALTTPPTARGQTEGLAKHLATLQDRITEFWRRCKRWIEETQKQRRVVEANAAEAQTTRRRLHRFVSQQQRYCLQYGSLIQDVSRYVADLEQRLELCRQKDAEPRAADELPLLLEAAIGERRRLEARLKRLTSKRRQDRRRIEALSLASRLLHPHVTSNLNDIIVPHVTSDLDDIVVRPITDLELLE